MTELMAESPPTHTPAVRRHRRRTWLIITLLIVGSGAGIAIKNYRYQFMAKNFAEVVPGQLYRAGYCEPRPLTRIIRDYHIKTILVLLNDEPDSAVQQKEVAIAQREGVRLIRIPMPGDGIAEFDALDQAAAVIANPANQPLLVHCYAGTMRTGASYAAWRMRHCGWSYQQAADECEDHEISPYYNEKFFAHLKRYHAERVAAPASRPG